MMKLALLGFAFSACWTTARAVERYLSEGAPPNTTKVRDQSGEVVEVKHLTSSGVLRLDERHGNYLSRKQ